MASVLLLFNKKNKNNDSSRKIYILSSGFYLAATVVFEVVMALVERLNVRHAMRLSHLDRTAINHANIFIRGRRKT